MALGDEFSKLVSETGYLESIVAGHKQAPEDPMWPVRVGQVMYGQPYILTEESPEVIGEYIKNDITTKLKEKKDEVRTKTSANLLSIFKAYSVNELMDMALSLPSPGDSLHEDVVKARKNLKAAEEGNTNEIVAELHSKYGVSMESLKYHADHGNIAKVYHQLIYGQRMAKLQETLVDESGKQLDEKKVTHYARDIITSLPEDQRNGMYDLIANQYLAKISQQAQE